MGEADAEAREPSEGASQPSAAASSSSRAPPRAAAPPQPIHARQVAHQKRSTSLCYNPLPDVAAAYVKCCVARYPISTGSAWLLLVIIIVIAAWAPQPFGLQPLWYRDSGYGGDAGWVQVVNVSRQVGIGALVTDSNTTAGRSLFQLALQMQGQEFESFAQFTVYLIFQLNEAYSADSALGSFVYREAASFEQKLRDSDSWRQLCGRVPTRFRSLCSPGLSLASYKLPTLLGTEGGTAPSGIVIDGNGQDVVPMGAATFLIQRHGIDKVLLPYGPIGTNTGQVAPRLFRSTFTFMLPCGDSDSTVSQRRDAFNSLTGEWGNFVQADLIPRLVQLKSDLETQGDAPFRVWFSGDGLDRAEAANLITWDAINSGASAIAIALVTSVFSTGSPLLGLLNAGVACLAGLLAYATVAGCGGSQLRIASLVLPPLGFGLAVNVVTAHSDVWEGVAKASGGEVTEEQCLVTAQIGAGSGPLLRSFVVALTLIASTFVDLDSVKQMGGILLLWVLYAAMFGSLGYLPFCAVEARAKGALRLNCFAHILAPIRNACHLPLCLPGRGKPGKFTCLSCCCTFVAVLLGILALSLMGASDVFPKLLPDGQNQATVVSFSDEFLLSATDSVSGVWRQPPPTTETLCRLDNFALSPGGLGQCAFSTCEVDATVTGGASNGACPCDMQTISPQWVNGKWTCGQLGSAQKPRGGLVRRVLSDSPLSASDLQVAQQPPSGTRPLGNSTVSVSTYPALLQSWETGERTLFQTTEIRAFWPQAENSTCGWLQVCFCGSVSCRRADGFKAATNIRLAAATQQQSADTGQRRLAVAPTQESNWSVVHVLVGLPKPKLDDVLPTKPSFSRAFRLADLQAQRSLYTLCAQLPANLLVVGKDCWIEDFRDWVHSQNLRFPVTDGRPQALYTARALSGGDNATVFQSLLTQFIAIEAAAGRNVTDVMWMENGQVRGYYMDFQVSFPANSTLGEVADYRSKWDAYIASWNARAAYTAGPAWHDSDLWWRTSSTGAATSPPESESSLSQRVGGFVAMAVFCTILAGCASINVWAALYTLIAMSGTVGSSAVLIFCLQGTYIGPLETSVLFVGAAYAMMYALQVYTACSDTTNAELRASCVAVLHNAWWSAVCALPLCFSKSPDVSRCGIAGLFTVLFAAVPAVWLLPGVLRVPRLGDEEPEEEEHKHRRQHHGEDGDEEEAWDDEDDEGDDEDEEDDEDGDETPESSQDSAQGRGRPVQAGAAAGGAKGGSALEWENLPVPLERESPLSVAGSWTGGSPHASSSPRTGSSAPAASSPRPAQERNRFGMPAMPPSSQPRLFEPPTRNWGLSEPAKRSSSKEDGRPMDKALSAGSVGEEYMLPPIASMDFTTEATAAATTASRGTARGSQSRGQAPAPQERRGSGSAAERGAPQERRGSGSTAERGLPPRLLEAYRRQRPTE